MKPATIRIVAELDDVGLVSKIVRGDQQAFLMLYDRHASHVYALTLRILHDANLAEEVTQDTFLKLWNHSQQYTSERGSLLVWLLTIARRTALDRIRMEDRRPTLSGPTDPNEAWQTVAEAGSTSEESRWRTMYMTVEGLPSDQRQVIDLAYYQGMSQSEIASTLGWPLGTVKTRLRSALEQLRRIWEDR